MAIQPTEHAVLFPEDIQILSEQVLARARARSLTMATAESCTGGLVAAALTAIAGSSDVVKGGVVSYANSAKMGLLGVELQVLDQYGAVSEPVARAMAEGALVRLQADLAVSITGVAGPGGGTAEKPVGLVHFATALRGGPTLARERRFGELGREGVRLSALRTALELLQIRLADES